MEGKLLNYQIRIITEDDTETVLSHLRKFFFKDEPLNEYVKLIEFEDSTCIELEQFCAEKIYEKNSVIAITPLGEVVGVCLNGTLEVDHGDDGECLNKKFVKILRLLNYCAKIAQPVFQERFPGSNKVLNVRVLSTDTAWRGHGIAGALIRESSTRARIQPYKSGLFKLLQCKSSIKAGI